MTPQPSSHLIDAPLPVQESERGDVPGWVLVTMMTAGLVVLLWGVAGPALSTMFTNALASVSGP